MRTRETIFFICSWFLKYNAISTSHSLFGTILEEGEYCSFFCMWLPTVFSNYLVVNIKSAGLKHESKVNINFQRSLLINGFLDILD